MRSSFNCLKFGPVSYFPARCKNILRIICINWWYNMMLHPRHISIWHPLFHFKMKLSCATRYVSFNRWLCLFICVSVGIEFCAPVNHGKLKVLVNPHSGPGKALQIFQKQVVPMLDEAELKYDLVTTGAFDSA